MTTIASLWALSVALMLAPLAQDGGWIRPFEGDGWGYTVTQAFGEPGGGRGRHHAGIDIAAPCGTPVRAMGDGTIVAASRARGDDGASVTIRLGPPGEPDATTLFVRYDHLMTLTRGPGSVTSGDVIGRSGRSGHATGCHLHLSIRRGTAPEKGYTQLPPHERDYLDPAAVFERTLGPTRR